MKIGKKALYWTCLGIVIVYSTVLTTFLLLTHSRDGKTVASVDNHKITRAQVVDKIIHDYWDNTVSSMSEDLVISDEAAKLNIIASNEDIAKEVKILEEYQHKNINLNDPEQSDIIQLRIITKKLAQKYIVNEDVIKTFLSERNGDIGDRNFHVITYESADHNLLSQIAQDAKQNPNPQALEKKFNIKFKEDLLTVDHNPNKLDLADLDLGSVEHLPNNNKNHIIIIVTGIDTVKIDDSNYEQNEDKILNAFLNLQYYKLKTDLVRLLFDKNHVNVHQI